MAVGRCLRDFGFRSCEGAHQRAYPLPTRPRDSSVLPIFGCILEKSVRVSGWHVASLYLISGDGCGVVGSALGKGVLPAPAFPNMDPTDSATAAVLPNRAD